MQTLVQLQHGSLKQPMFPPHLRPLNVAASLLGGADGCSHGWCCRCSHLAHREGCQGVIGLHHRGVRPHGLHCCCHPATEVGCTACSKAQTGTRRCKTQLSGLLCCCQQRSLPLVKKKTKGVLAGAVRQSMAHTPLRRVDSKHASHVCLHQHQQHRPAFQAAAQCQ